MESPIRQRALDQLIAAAKRSSLVAVADLVELRFMDVADIADLRAAGLEFLQIKSESVSEEIWVGAQGFLEAAASVAESRAATIVGDLEAPATGRLH